MPINVLDYNRWKLISSDRPIANGENVRYWVDTSAGEVDITFPVSPVSNQEISLWLVAGSSNVRVFFSGQRYRSVLEPGTAISVPFPVTFVHVNPAIGWVSNLEALSSLYSQLTFETQDKSELLANYSQLTFETQDKSELLANYSQLTFETQDKSVF